MDDVMDRKEDSTPVAIVMGGSFSILLMLSKELPENTCFQAKVHFCIIFHSFQLDASSTSDNINMTTLSI